MTQSEECLVVSVNVVYNLLRLQKCRDRIWLIFYMAFRSLLFLQSLTFLVSSATIPTPGNHNDSLNLFQLLPDTALLPTTPGAQASSVDTSLTVSEAQCHTQQGEKVDPGSCRSAISKIPRSTDYITFGARSRGNFDVTLPYVWVSGMCRLLKLVGHAPLIASLASAFFPREKKKAGGHLLTLPLRAWLSRRRCVLSICIWKGYTQTGHL